MKPKYDVFISHSSRDKNDVVRPLVTALEERGLSVWYDENIIKIGDSIKESVINGLSQSLCAVIIITDNFFSSNWTWLESGFMLSKNVQRPLIPVLHGIDHSIILNKMPFIGDLKFATTEVGFDSISHQIFDVVMECKSLPYTATSDIGNLISHLKFLPQDFLVAITTEIRDYKSAKDIDYRLGIIKAKFIVDSLIKALWRLKFGLNAEMPVLNSKNANEVISAIGPTSSNTLEYLKLILEKSLQAAKSEAAVSKEDENLVEESLFRFAFWICEIGQVIKRDKKENPFLAKVYPGDFSKEDIIDTYIIEKRVLRHDLISEWNEAYKWYKYNNYTFIGIRDAQSNKIIAFANLIPITEEYAERIKSGTITDVEIPLKDIRQYNLPDFYIVYIASFCIDPDHQKSNAFLILYNMIIEILLGLAKDKEVYIQKIIAEASTDDGEKLCKFIDMKQVTTTTHGTKIYEVTLIPPELRLRSKFGNELLRFCKKKYIEFKDLL